MRNFEKLLNLPQEGRMTSKGLGFHLRSMSVLELLVIVPLKYIEYRFGYFIVGSPYPSYSIYLRGTIPPGKEGSREPRSVLSLWACYGSGSPLRACPPLKS